MGSGAHSFIRVAVFTFMALAFSGMHPAVAADDRNWDRFSVQFSMFRPDINTEVRLDPVAGPFGTALDMESDLGLEDSDDLWQLDARLRFSKRFAMEASYFEIGRSGQSTLSTTVNFGDTNFPVNADAETEFDTDILAASLRFSFIHNDTMELAGSLGAYWMTVDAGITVPALSLSESADVGAPLPLLGMDFRFNFLPKLALNVRGRYFGVDIEDIDGSLTNFNIGLQYDVFDFFGIGLGYESFDFDVTSNNEDFPGFLRFEYKGPKIFTTFQF
jgi:hypothetical protein